MKRLIILLIALTLSACAPESSLWGIQFTPTPHGQFSAPFILVTPSPLPTNTSLPTETSAPTETASPTATDILATQTLVQVVTPNPQDQPEMYYAQSGDSLAAVAARFNVEPAQITSPKNLPSSGLVDEGTLLLIPRQISGGTTPNIRLVPDSEIIFSNSATSFDIAGFVQEGNGYLAGYKQWITSSGSTSGTDVIVQLTRNNSPWLQLSLIHI